MKASVGSEGYGAKSHTIILTKGRPQMLARCVAAAMSTLPAAAAVTVLDDSDRDRLLADSAVLSEAARRSRATITHLGAASLHETVAKALNGRAIWQSRTAPRDIAPLRNLSLLISLAVGAQTTIMVDDDVCHFDLRATVETIDALDGPEGLVVGATIEGTTEQDTVTRLLEAVRALERAGGKEARGIERLFRATSDVDDREGHGYGLPSAGYTAFRIPSAKLFAFPPGYNEDWLWSLLHKAEGKTRVLRTAQPVVHAPPALRRSSRIDILFEMVGGPCGRLPGGKSGGGSTPARVGLGRAAATHAQSVRDATGARRRVAPPRGAGQREREPTRAP